jgi:hypothetical protein
VAFKNRVVEDDVGKVISIYCTSPGFKLKAILGSPFCTFNFAKLKGGLGCCFSNSSWVGNGLIGQCRSVHRRGVERKFRKGRLVEPKMQTNGWDQVTVIYRCKEFMAKYCFAYVIFC